MSDRARAESWLRRLPVLSPEGVDLVDLLDAIDAGEEDQECEEAEPEEDNWENGTTVYIREYCPCCGSQTNHEEWIT